ncbi:hypothetical protein HPP92_005826 [Vanilla planifolia]|uniref:Uncharacterized protein n=1 Tax=Vanilla planifolia TaxID=51239 RepID=A0A835RZG1_VANPL|nr:hypothetical protein HPP92_005826 [Vanilla planifolia]
MREGQVLQVPYISGLTKGLSCNKLSPILTSVAGIKHQKNGLSDAGRPRCCHRGFSRYVRGEELH